MPITIADLYRHVIPPDFGKTVAELAFPHVDFAEITRPVLDRIAAEVAETVQLQNSVLAAKVLDAGIDGPEWDKLLVNFHRMAFAPPLVTSEVIERPSGVVAVEVPTITVRRGPGRPTGPELTRDQLLQRAEQAGRGVGRNEGRAYFTRAIPRSRLAHKMGLGERTLQRYVNDYELVTDDELLAGFLAGLQVSLGYFWPGDSRHDEDVQEDDPAWRDYGSRSVKRRSIS